MKSSGWLLHGQQYIHVHSLQTKGLFTSARLTGLNFAFGSHEKFQPGFWDEKRPKIVKRREEFWRQIRNTRQTWKNTNILTFVPIIALATLEAVSLQWNGMLIMWKIRQAMQDDTIRTIRIYPTFILVTGLTVISVWKNDYLGNWGPVQTLLHSCAEPNWWIKYGKRATSELIWYGSFSLVRQKH